MKAILNRTTPGSGIKTLEIGGAVVNLATLTVETNSGEQPLGRYETDILRLLASEPGRVYSRDEILAQIWGMEAATTNRTIDNHIVKLRQKIEPDPAKPIHILSIYGKGYKLATNQTEPG